MRFERPRFWTNLKRGPDPLDVAVFNNRAHRTYGGALAALDAGNVGEAERECRTDDRWESPFLREEGAHALYPGAGGNAPPALDALRIVPHERRRRVVDHRLRFFSLIAQRADAGS